MVAAFSAEEFSEALLCCSGFGLVLWYTSEVGRSGNVESVRVGRKIHERIILYI